MWKLRLASIFIVQVYLKLVQIYTTSAQLQRIPDYNAQVNFARRFCCVGMKQGMFPWLKAYNTLLIQLHCLKALCHYQPTTGNCPCCHPERSKSSVSFNGQATISCRRAFHSSFTQLISSSAALFRCPAGVSECLSEICYHLCLKNSIFAALDKHVMKW